MRRLLRLGAYNAFVQNRVVQAQYWHDPFKQTEYLDKSVFLADINNERTQKNATYKANFASLRKLVMVKFLRDTMVQPRESEWFGFYRLGQDTEILPMRQTQLYLEDWIGLRTLDEAGKVYALSSDTDHLRFTDAWFDEHILPHLRD